MNGAGANRKGRKAERKAVDWIRANGFPWAERRGRGESGPDVTGLGPGLEVEVKDRDRMALAEWVDQVTADAEESGAVVALVLHKRRGKTDVGDWYATMPASVAFWLIRAAGYGTPLDKDG